MVDGEVSVMMMAMISSNSPSRQGARTEFLVAETESLSLVAKRNSSLENVEPPMFLGHRKYVARRRGREALGGSHTTPGAA